MLSLDCFEKALRGPAVHRLFEAVARQKLQAKLRAKVERMERLRAERSAAIHEAWERAMAPRPHCPIEWLPPGVPLTFHTFTGRLRLRAPWPAAQWIRT